MNSNKKLRLTGTTQGSNQKHTHINFPRRNTERHFDRRLLPTPAKYYSDEFPGLKIKSEWVKVRCCFHEDNIPSLNISMIDGHFRCFACDAKGCDVIAFQKLRYGMNFIEAVNYFGAWSHE